MKTKREITAREYEEVASRLTDAINGNTYFSDSISGEGWRFTPSVMVYWHTDTLGSGEKWIWWEFHTFDAEGDEVLNDFKTSTLELFLGI